MVVDWMVDSMMADWVVVDWVVDSMMADWVVIDWVVIDWVVIDWMVVDCRHCFLRYTVQYFEFHLGGMHSRHLH